MPSIHAQLDRVSIRTKILAAILLVTVIVSGGDSNDPVVARFADYGFVDALPKPSRIEVLDVIVQRAHRDGEVHP